MSDLLSGNETTPSSRNQIGDVFKPDKAKDQMCFHLKRPFKYEQPAVPDKEYEETLRPVSLAERLKQQHRLYRANEKAKGLRLRQANDGIKSGFLKIEVDDLQFKKGSFDSVIKHSKSVMERTQNNKKEDARDGCVSVTQNQKLEESLF